MGMACTGAGIEGFSLELDPWVDFHSLNSSPKVGSASKTAPIWSLAVMMAHPQLSLLLGLHLPLCWHTLLLYP